MTTTTTYHTLTSQYCSSHQQLLPHKLSQAWCGTNTASSSRTPCITWPMWWKVEAHSSALANRNLGMYSTLWSWITLILVPAFKRFCTLRISLHNSKVCSPLTSCKRSRHSSTDEYLPDNWVLYARSKAATALIPVHRGMQSVQPPSHSQVVCPPSYPRHDFKTTHQLYQNSIEKWNYTPMKNRTCRRAINMKAAVKGSWLAWASNVAIDKVWGVCPPPLSRSMGLCANYHLHLLSLASCIRLGCAPPPPVVCVSRSMVLC